MNLINQKKYTKALMIYAIWVLFAFQSHSQNCSGDFTDTGGISGLYTNNENYTVTLCPDMPAIEVMELTFYAFDVNDFDVTSPDLLAFFDGPNITAPSLGEFNGTTASSGPGRITATNVSGCLTVKFVSNNDNFVGSGWIADKACRSNNADRFHNFDIVNENLTVSACNNLEADHAIFGTSVVEFNANNEILMLPGFQVAQGASFLAMIEDCANTNLKEEETKIAKSFFPSRFDSAVKLKSKESLQINPNPFVYTTSIYFDLLSDSPVNLEVYDLTGNLVQTLLLSKNQKEGKHQVEWQNEQLSKGMYIILLTTEMGQASQKVIIQ